MRNGMSKTLHLSDSPAPLVVTGAGGWLGRALSSHIVANAQSLGISRYVALVRTNEEKKLLEAELVGISTVKSDIRLCDVTSTDAINSVLVDLNPDNESSFDLIHTAGIIHPKKIQDLYQVNEVGTRNIMKFALDHHARKVVHVSSNSPFGNNPHSKDLFRSIEPFNPYMAYGESKMRGEIAVQEAVSQGLHAVIVRPPWFYGPFQPARQTTFFSMVKAGRFPVFGDGSQHRSMVFIDNLVDGVLRARQWKGEPGKGWWIADQTPYRVSEIVSLVGQALRDEGHDVKTNRLRIPNIVGSFAETADALIQKTGRYVQQVHVLGEMNKTIACDISASTSELGYIPQTSLYEGMRQSIRWCAEQGIEL